MVTVQCMFSLAYIRSATSLDFSMRRNVCSWATVIIDESFAITAFAKAFDAWRD